MHIEGKDINHQTNVSSNNLGICENFSKNHSKTEFYGIKDKKSNSKNVFMRKITGLLSDENLLDAINYENEWLKEKIQTNVNIIKTDSNPNLNELTKMEMTNNSLNQLLKQSKDSNLIGQLTTQLNSVGTAGTKKENSHEDDELLGKRVRKLTNSESARNSRKRKRLYIELLEEKLRLEERKNGFLNDEIKALKKQNNNIMNNSLEDNKYLALFNINQKENMFKRAINNKHSTSNLEAIFEEYIDGCRNVDNNVKNCIYYYIEAFFEKMRHSDIGCVIECAKKDISRRIQEDNEAGNNQFYNKFEDLLKLNMDLCSTSTLYKDSVMNKTTEYLNIRDDIKLKISNIIRTIPKEKLIKLLPIAANNYLQNREDDKKNIKDQEELDILYNNKNNYIIHEPLVKKIFVSNEDMLHMI